MIPERVARRARWVLTTLDAHVALDDAELVLAEWEALDRGEWPARDELAQAFYHLARVEERAGPRDAHGRFLAAASRLEPLDPPLERLRSRLGGEPQGFAGKRFAVCLTHDVDVPWRWTPIGVRGAAARLKEHVVAGRAAPALREARALAGVPVHRLRGTDPNWRFDHLLARERERNVRSTFFVLGGYRHRADGPAPAAYERLRPRLVETLRDGGGEVAVHGSYTAADDREALCAEKEGLERLLGDRVSGQRFHYLRVDPHRNLAPLAGLGFDYDSSLGFPDTPGFRAGIAAPFRPWDFRHERPADLVEVPLALMDVSFDARYLDLPARRAEAHVMALLDGAADRGGAFAVLWHTDRFDRGTAAGWDRLYERLIDGVHERGGACLAAADLAAEASARLAEA